MRNKCVQISLFDTYSDVSRATEEDKPKFFRLLEKYINWDELIPPDFYWAFHKRMGRKRTYSLESFIRALVLQRIFGYTEDTQLLNILRHSKEMRENPLPRETRAFVPAKILARLRATADVFIHILTKTFVCIRALPAIPNNGIHFITNA